MTASLPVLSLADDPAPFAAALGGSFRAHGFALVADHGIDPALIARGWALAARFFALPEAEKLRWHDPANAGARGYTPFGREVAVKAPAADLKEFWHIGRDLPPGHPRLSSSMPANVWPDAPAGFRETFAALFAAFDAVGARLLAAVARHLGLAEDWFGSLVAEGNSVLRLLHYPPLGPDAPENAIRAAAHGDINLITLLLGAEEAGLELRTRAGDWLAIDPPPGALVVNIGDMLERLTNHALPSTIHRVRNPAGPRAAFPRYSMPFFVHLASDIPLATLPGCATPEHPDRYPPAPDGSLPTADDFLQQRLREIGLGR